MPRIHLVSNLPGVSALGDHLRAAGLGPTSARSADALLVLIDRPLDSVEQELLDRARQSVPVLLAGPTVRALPADSPLVEASGLVPGRGLPPHELALVPGPDGAEVAARMGDFRPVDSWILPDKIADDVERLLFVRHELAEYPVCTWRPSAGLGIFTLGSTASTLADPEYHRLVGRWLRHALGVSDGGPVGVGLLATPTTGVAHQAAVEATEGLRLVAISGPAPAAGGQVRAYDEADALVADDEVGLVIVATPNHTRAQWASRVLEAGKDVVVAAPFALSTQETDDLALLAAARSALAVMHSEQRSDPAYRALAAMVRRGAIGDVLAVDAVFGAFHRPAGSWRDDERTSGGLILDRGFGLLDLLLDLVDEPVERVSASTHKRVWHHVTNADHARVLLRFASGAEAQLVLSDLLPTPTARLEVLGTAGALLSDGTPGDPAALGAVTLATHDGARTRCSTLAPAAYPFHRDLADALLSGWPLPRHGVETARRVVAVAEAATRSAAAGGTQVIPG